MLIISETKELEDFCQFLEKCEYIALDTEFIRDQIKYYPQCSLIQINGGGNNKLALIDVLACNDLSPLIKILTNNTITKVFHSCRQDIELLYGYLKVDVVSLFDTQIGAMFLGANHSIGYDTLIQKYLNKSINKNMQFSKWLNRPLSQAQLDYAATDVDYLYQVYPIMKNDLEKNFYYSWVLEECINIITKSKPLISTIINSFLAECHNEKEAVIISKIVEAREVIAEKTNLHRCFIMQDKDVYIIAKEINNRKSIFKNSPISVSHYEEIKEKKKTFTSDISKIIEDYDRKYDKNDKKSLHVFYIRKRFLDFIYNNDYIYDNLSYIDMISNYKKNVIIEREARNSPKFTIIKEMMIQVSKDTGIALEILSSKRDIVNFLLNFKTSRLEVGWRRQLLQQKNLDISII